jgi:hypothetical protein
MGRSSGVAVLVALLGVSGLSGMGCGSEAIPVDDDGAGGAGGRGSIDARLVVQIWDAGDGAVMPRGWHDRELDVDCEFSLAADGRHRCLPTGERVAGQRDVEVFADASCSVPAAPRPACAPPLAYVRRAPREMPTCSDLAAEPVFAVGDVLDTTTVYVREGGCTPVPGEADALVYEVGDEVPPSEFVGADLAPQGAGRLATYALVADDGAVDPVAIWDSELGECELGGDLAAPACRPTETAMGVPPTWGDPACTERVAMDDRHERPCVTPTAVWDPTAPASGSRLRTIGAALEADQVYRKDDTGTCAAQDVAADRTYYAMGAEIPLDALAPLGEASEGTGRVVVKRVTDASGAVIGPATTFWDTEIDEECAPLELADGYHCVGDLAPGDLFFQDAECAVGVVLGDGHTRPTLAGVDREPTDACDAGTLDQIYRVGALVSVPQPYVRDITGSCHPPDWVAPDGVFYALGEPFQPPRLEAR